VVEELRAIFNWIIMVAGDFLDFAFGQAYAARNISYRAEEISKKEICSRSTLTWEPWRDYGKNLDRGASEYEGVTSRQ